MPTKASVSLAPVYCCVLFLFLTTTTHNAYSLMKHTVSHKPCPVMYIDYVGYSVPNPYLIFMAFRELAVHSPSESRTSLQ
jgi:hypothetical protein